MTKPKLPVKQKRIPLHVTVSPMTMEKISEIGAQLEVTLSVAIDIVVAAYKPRKERTS